MTTQTNFLKCFGRKLIHNVYWEATDVEIEHYSAKSYTSLNAVTPPDAIECIDPSCSCNEHQMQLDVYFDSICNALYDTSKQTIPTSKMKCSSEYIVPGFNDYLKELHTNARNSYLTWKKMGKPRGDDTDMYYTCEPPDYSLSMLYGSVASTKK